MIPMNGRKVSARELRRQLNTESAIIEQQAIPAINRLMHNDRVTQKKLTDLLARIDALNSMTAWQRVCWLVRGVL